MANPLMKNNRGLYERPRQTFTSIQYIRDAAIATTTNRAANVTNAASVNAANANAANANDTKTPSAGYVIF